MSTGSLRPWDAAQGAQGFGRSYTVAEEKARTNVHYELPADLFITVTGGRWNTYSCNLWDGARDQTESQEAKLDLMAELMQLRRGQRVLDVGSGWGGPIVYLAQRYGITGVGISPSSTQQAYGARRAREAGVDVAVHRAHWSEYEDGQLFDAIYTDEAIVHFHDLEAFFAKARRMLKPGGVFLNKELHWVDRTAAASTRSKVLINNSFGETGNYRLIHEELSMLDRTGFAIERIQQIDLEHYRRTLDCWVENMHASREALEASVGAETYRRFHTYYRILRRGTLARSMTLDCVLARAPSE